MKTALVYDWFSENAGGGEKTFEAIYELFPSPIYTLLQAPKSLEGKTYEKSTVHSSFIQKLPFAAKKYRSYLPFFPLAIEQFDLSSYELILSCSHCVAKGVMTHADQLHICYCFTPMRYAWDLYHQYLQESGLQKGIKAKLAQFFLHYLRMWDMQTCARTDVFGAISHYVAKRIRKTYGRDAHVIYPPVDTDFFSLSTKKEEFYLAASRFVPYKRIDLIVEAFSQMPEKRLVVIGDGPDWVKVKSKATQNIELLGYQSDETLKQYLQKAKAFVFAAIEDFGILPIEAQSCGTPVIAFQKGAVKETIQDGVTGLFFSEQTVEAIVGAVRAFERTQDKYCPEGIRKHAEQFNRSRFMAEYRDWVQSEWEQFKTGKRPCMRSF
ncbi:MAG TPA: glycosyltransferase [Chlamydiales bacterium]|nr:glycosyltransferase [Chlamydiales bacterium]